MIREIEDVIFLIILLMLLISLNSNIYAETAKKINQTQQQNTSQEKKINKQTTKSRAKKFIPTEKIKADTSVPFPVDI